MPGCSDTHPPGSSDSGILPTLAVLTGSMNKTISTQRLIIVALTVMLLAISGVEIWRIQTDTLAYVTLGSGIQRTKPGTLDESYLADYSLGLVRLLGNVNKDSVRDALRLASARMSPELRVQFSTLHNIDAGQLEVDAQWIHTPRINVESIKEVPSELGHSSAYVVTLKADQYFGFLDQHSGRRETRIVIRIEPGLYQGEAWAYITDMSWPNMLRSDGAIDYKPGKDTRS